MGIKQLYNDNLRKLLNEYGDVSVMVKLLQLTKRHGMQLFFFPTEMKTMHQARHKREDIP